MAHARALAVGPLGAWGVFVVYMGMTVGCSASSPPPLRKICSRIVNLITMETVAVGAHVGGRSVCHCASKVLQDVSGMVIHAKRVNTKEHLEIELLAHTRYPSFKHEFIRQDCV